ncbi:hypothetical protein FWD07_01450 [Candidatus Saccharibacteria bacterium]|nr:hypothetical protein [Candidatus Saccharibacteria bacterium]
MSKQIVSEGDLGGVVGMPGKGILVWGIGILAATMMLMVLVVMAKQRKMAEKRVRRMDDGVVECE